MKKFFISNIFVIIFLLLFSFVSIGYALYSEPISLNGNIAVMEGKIIEITDASIVREECSNLTSYNEPSYEGMNISFNINTRSSNFSATYLVTITNNSNRDYTYTGFPVSARIEGNENVPIVTSTVTNVSTNSPLEAGELIRSGESLTIKLKLDFSINEASSITVIVNGNITAQEDNSGSINTSISPNTGDLRGKDTLAPFTINIINTFKYRRIINLTSSNENIMIVDSNGNPYSTIAIDANSSSSYPIYLKVKEGSIFLSDTTTTNIIVSSNGIIDIDTGVLTLNVDKDIIATDNEKVQVGNINLFINSVDTKDGEATVTFDRLDSGGSSVVNYVITLINNDTKEESIYETGNAITSYTFSNLSVGNYSVRVYGIDEAGNSGEDDCSNATSSGYCAISTSTYLKWYYDITTDLDELSFDGEATTLIYSSYEGTLALDTYDVTKGLPDSITVTMNGKDLVSGVDYTYDASSGKVVINKVTGNIHILASAKGTSCLIEGTLVRLANGKYKKIEDINYNDLLMVYDHENGGITYEYPIWIEKPKTTTYYQKTTFTDGSYLETYGPHSVFSPDCNNFIDVTNRDLFNIGTSVVKITKNGNIKIVTVAKIETIKEKRKYYHISSTRYHNIITNDILTDDATGFSTFLYNFNDDLTWGNKRDEYLKTNDLFPYEFLEPYFPKYLFFGYRMEESKNVYNKGLLNINYYANILQESNTKEVLKDKDNNNLWMVTTSDDKVTNKNKDNYLYIEDSFYTLKKPKNKKNFIGWLNTADNKIYQPNDKVKVLYGTHFVAKYKD